MSKPESEWDRRKDYPIAKPAELEKHEPIMAEISEQAVTGESVKMTLKLTDMDGKVVGSETITVSLHDLSGPTEKSHEAVDVAIDAAIRRHRGRSRAPQFVKHQRIL